MVSIDELRLDVEELHRLSGLTERTSVKTRLDGLVNDIQKKIDEVARVAKVRQETAARKAAAAANPSSALPTVKITNYGWDQSDKFVKLYVSIDGVHKVPTENVQSQFTHNSFSLLIQDVNGKNHSMEMKDLLHDINIENSQVKQKTDSMVVMLRKVKESEHWDVLTKVEHQAKEKKAPKVDDKSDPQAALMDMMKQMYDEGDDEMKRNIRKAWHEGQQKKGGMGGPMGMGMEDF